MRVPLKVSDTDIAVDALVLDPALALVLDPSETIEKISEAAYWWVKVPPSLKII